MRTILIIVVVVLLIAGGAALYLHLTTPAQGGGVRVPVTAAQRALLANVPASADAFALIPRAAAVEAKLRANAVTREAVDDWGKSRPLPPPWLIGGADLVVWRSGKRTSYALNLDPVRSLFLRVWTLAGASVDVRRTSSAILIGAPDEPPMAAAELDSLLALAEGLPPGDALAMQRESCARSVSADRASCSDDGPCGA